MNKRKPDDEFARIKLSYLNAAGEEIVVECPESRNATATLEPERRELVVLTTEEPKARKAATPAVGHTPAPATPLVQPRELPIEPEAPEERHFTILYGDTGYTYESIIGP